MYTTVRQLYSSKGASDVTSEVVWVGDADYLSLHLPTASTTTVQGSNDDGRSSAIANWTDLQTLTTAGVYTIDPGVRWLRVLSTKTDAILALTVKR